MQTNTTPAAIQQGIEALQAAQKCLGSDRMSLTGWDREQWDYYQRAIHALSNAAASPAVLMPVHQALEVKEARKALETLAAFPKTRHEEMSAESMRRYARGALQSLDGKEAA